jgi:hypothetical protein
VPKPSPDAAPRLARFAGRWAPTTGCHSCTPRRAPAILPITANADGTLGFTGGRFIEVEPMLFVHDDGTGYIAFRADSTGQPVELFAGGFWSFERLPEPSGAR